MERLPYSLENFIIANFPYHYKLLMKISSLLRQSGLYFFVKYGNSLIWEMYRKVSSHKMGNHEDRPWINQARNSISPRIQEDSFTDFSEKIDVRVTNKLSQEFRRKKNSHFWRLIKTIWVSSEPKSPLLLRTRSVVCGRPSIQTEKTREQTKTNSTRIVILKLVFPWASPHRC